MLNSLRTIRIESTSIKQEDVVKKHRTKSQKDLFNSKRKHPTFSGLKLKDDGLLDLFL